MCQPMYASSFLSKRMLLMSTLLKIDVSKAAEEKRNHPTSLSTQNEERYSRQWIAQRRSKQERDELRSCLFTKQCPESTEIFLQKPEKSGIISKQSGFGRKYANLRQLLYLTHNQSITKKHCFIAPKQPHQSIAFTS